MKKRFFDQPFFSAVSDDLPHPWSFVDGAGEGEGGGGATPPSPPAPTVPPTPPAPPAPPAPSGGDDGDGLGDVGKKTLAKIRQEKDAIKKELDEAKEQIEKMKPYIEPEKYRELMDRLEESKQNARRRELELQQQKNETEEQFQSRLIEAHQQRDSERKAREEAEARAEREKEQRLAFAKRTALSSAFYANGGREGQDEEGTTFFDLFMNARGEARSEYDPTDGKTYAIDKDGNRVVDKDGKPIPLGDWMNQLADTNPVIGALFAARGGSGGGGLQGAKGVRPVQSPDIEAQRKRRPESLLHEAFDLK